MIISGLMHMEVEPHRPPTHLPTVLCSNLLDILRMARKRTPTKDANNHNREGKANSLEPTTKPSSSKDNVKQQPKPWLKTSHLTLVTIFITFITGLVCYSVYPELTSLTSIKRKPMPSLRKIVDSNQNNDILQRDISQEGLRNVFQPDKVSEIVSIFGQAPNLYRASDEEVAKLRAKFLELKTRKEEEGESDNSSQDVKNSNTVDLEPKRHKSLQSISESLKSSQIKGDIPEHDSGVDKLNHGLNRPKSNSESVETPSSKDSESLSDNSLSKNQDIDIRPHTVDSKGTKNMEVLKSTSAEKKIINSQENAPQRKGESKKKGPIILSAENPHMSLDFNDIQSESATQKELKHPNKEKLDTKQIKKKEIKSSTSRKNSEEVLTNQKMKGLKLSETTKENAEKKTDEQRNSVKQKQSSKGSSKSHVGSGRSETEITASFQRTFVPKKTFYGGRRIAPVELLNQKPSNSSVKVYLFDDFLSQQECEGLMRVHNHHIKANTKPPILCFDSLNTLRKHIRDAGKRVKITSQIFTEGTSCVNESFSLQLQSWLNSNWSYSTAFYPGESKFSTVCHSEFSLHFLAQNVAGRLQQAMGLKPENGGKFQITSYPLGKAYKTHTDCTLGGVDKRDRVVSVLMYLNDAEDGGETRFPDLGIWVKPRRGRAIVWNNMSPSGGCEPHSRHTASIVKKGKKYILIRWYYYQSFLGLGQRPTPPYLPERDEHQAKVSCDDYDNGSCRWYDEWTYEHLLEYPNNKLNIS